MQFKKLALSLFALIFCAGAIAQKGVTVVPIPGSCGAFANARSTKNEPQAITDLSMVTGWIWGYMSSYNIDHAKNSITIPSQAATLDLYVEKYCRENPLKSLPDATRRLIVDLGVWAAEKIRTHQKNFDLAESRRSDYFAYTKG